MENSSMFFLDLEKRLLEDSSGKLKKELITLIFDKLQEVKKIMDAGLTPSEFEIAKKVQGSLKAALMVIEKIQPEN